MALLNIKNLALKQSVTLNTIYNVSGEVTGPGGFPWLGPLWVVAVVTYPTGLFSILNTAQVSANAIAVINGKFSINFPSGFNQSGTYKLDLNAYLGPTTHITEGVQIASISATVPPIPSVATIPTATFTVTGNANSGNTKGTVGYIAGEIEANYSSQYRNTALPISISYTGETIGFVFGIQNRDAVSQFMGATVVITDPSGKVTTLTQAPVSIAVGEGISIGTTGAPWSPVYTPGINGTYVVLVRVWKNSDAVANQLDTVTESPGFTVTGVGGGGGGGGGGSVATGHIAQPIEANYNGKIGTNSALPVSFPLTGSGDTLGFLFGIQNDSEVSYPLLSIVTITDPNGNTFTQQFGPENAGANNGLTARFTFPANTLTVNGVYQLKAQLWVNNILVDTEYNYFTVTGGGSIPTVTTLSANYSNGVVYYQYSGFQPNQQVTIAVYLGGQVTSTASDSGSGSGSFYDNDSPGGYQLSAIDSYGHIAYTGFTIPFIGPTEGTTYDVQYSDGSISYGLTAADINDLDAQGISYTIIATHSGYGG